MTAYLKVRSWHTLVRVDAGGWWTRCGLCVRENAPASDTLPLGDHSCETCLRLDRHDREKAPPETLDPEAERRP